MGEYYAGLLFQTLNMMQYIQLSKGSEEYAQLSALMPCEELDKCD